MVGKGLGGGPSTQSADRRLGFIVIDAAIQELSVQLRQIEMAPMIARNPSAMMRAAGNTADAVPTSGVIARLDCELDGCSVVPNKSLIFHLPISLEASPR